MFIDKDSIKIDNVSIGQYLTRSKFGYHKIWGKDSGRNMAFEMTGTLGGIFPKITLTFRRLNEEEMYVISSLLNKASTTVQYYDPEFKSIKEIVCYSSDWEFDQKDCGIAESFNASIISKKKRS